jgi:hypothetical protein
MHGHSQHAGGGAVHAQCIGGRATHATLVHLLPFYSTARYCVSSSRITDTEHVHAQFFVYSVLDLVPLDLVGSYHNLSSQPCNELRIIGARGTR